MDHSPSLLRSFGYFPLLYRLSARSFQSCALHLDGYGRENPPPRYTLSGLVYLLRLQDGTVAAMHLPSHLNAAGQKGYVTIDYIWPY